MTWRQAFTGMLQLLAVFFLFGAAVFLVALPFVPELRFSLVRLLLEKPDLLAVGGIALFGVALLMTMGFLGVGRGRFLLLRMGGKLAAAIDANVLRKTIAPLLRKQFSKRVALSNVEIVRGKHLEIGLALQSMTPEERERVLLEAETHLKTLLAERFGYRESFTVQTVERS